MTNFYTGVIHPDNNTIFVFGSNPEGRHGVGAARTARLLFGAVYGQGEGLQGNAYAIPTATITESIRKMYRCARQMPDKRFCIAYRNTYSYSLNGYTGLEMIRMFLDAGPIPENVLVSKEWYETGMFN